MKEKQNNNLKNEVETKLIIENKEFELNKYSCELCWGTEKEKDLIILTGITTSQINQTLKANNPYPARVFLKVEEFDQEEIK